MLISDDWNEINIEDLTIDPVSSVFSPDQLNNFYQEAFESFGKRFYWKHGVRPYPQLRLGSIIELHSNESSLNDGQFLERSMSHVPLLAQPLSDRDFDNLTNFSSSDLERYQMFQQQYHQAYENLISRVDRHQVINCKDNNSLKDITSQIMLIISL